MNLLTKFSVGQYVYGNKSWLRIIDTAGIRRKKMLNMVLNSLVLIGLLNLLIEVMFVF